MNEADVEPRPECTTKKPDWARLIIWVFILSLTIRALWVAAATVSPIGDHHGYNRSALEWLQTGSYRVQSKYIAYKPPGYPGMVASIYALFGSDWKETDFENAINWHVHGLLLYHDWKVIGLVQAVMGALVSCLLALLAGKTISYRTGVAAGILHCLWPTSIVFVPVMANDNLLVLLLIIGLLCLAGCRDGRGFRRTALACAAGVVLGMMIFVRPSSIFFVPAWFLLGLYDPIHRLWRRRVLVLSMAAAAVAIAPWLYYTYSKGLGVGVFSTQGGYGLWWGNNWRSVDGGNPAPPRFPGDRELTEREQHEFFMDKAVTWIRNNPERYLALSRTRLIRMFGKQCDVWASKYFFPTEENDRLLRAAYWKHMADPEDIKKGQAMERRNRAMHQNFRLVAAPLMALAILLALLRPRAYAYALAPLLFYALGHALTVFAGRYRVTSDPLILMCLAGYITGIVRPVAEAGFWRGRWPKIILGAAAITGSIYVHVTKLDRGWYSLPKQPEPMAEFNEELGRCWDIELSPVMKIKEFSSKACTMDSTWTDDGWRFDLHGSEATEGYQYAGIALPAEGMTAMRIDLSWYDPLNIDAIFVDGRNADNEQCVKWEWRPRAAKHNLAPPGRSVYVLVSGQQCGHFIPRTHEQDCQVATIRIYVRIVRNTNVSFVLHGVSAATPAESGSE